MKAFNVSATSANGYGALGAPTGRYLAPANGPDCIETAPGYGDCGLRSLVVNGPRLVRFDLSVVEARSGSRGRRDRPSSAVEMLNAFNTPYFNPASTGGTPLGIDDDTFTAPGGPTSRRDADRQCDGGIQRRQLPSDAAARRQPGAHHSAGLARALVDGLQGSRRAQSRRMAFSATSAVSAVNVSTFRDTDRSPTARRA